MLDYVRLRRIFRSTAPGWFAVIMLGCLYTAATSSQSGNCRPSDSWSRNSVEHFRSIVTGVDAGSSKARQLFQLPYVSTSPAVVHVQDDAECAREADALDAMYADGTPHRPVYLLRIGTTRYAVSDGSPGGRGNALVHLFDAAYSYLATLD